MPRGSAHDKVERDARIVADRVRGLTWPTIAERHGLTERQCRNVCQAHRERRPALFEIDPLETIRDALEGYDAAIEDLALVAESATHDAVKLGAIKARLDATTRKIELMQAVGLLPDDLGQLPLIEDAREVVAAILAVFDAYGVPDEAALAVLDAVEGREPSHPKDRPG